MLAIKMKGLEAAKVKSDNKLLKAGIWAYLLLLIFEGALRKWFLPSLAAPLLIIRDPIALWIIFNAIQKGMFPKSTFVFWMVFVGISSLLTALFFGHGNIKVAMFGARVLLIHFPLAFAIGNILKRKDVIYVGKVLVYFSIPMTVLIGLQFSSPQTAWVNRGLGGVIEEVGFQGALGHFRPSATFSFITGTYLFYGLVASYIFYFWLNEGLINKLVLTGATVALLAAIPLSISRTLFFEIGLSVVFLVLGASIKTKYFGKMVMFMVGGVILLIILSFTPYFQHAIETFTTRFTDASTQEGGVKGTLGDRFLGGLVSAISSSGRLPFFGYGIGMGTNVGSQLLSGTRIFLLHEEEWGRIIDEQGQLLGFLVVFMRIMLTYRLSIKSYQRLLQGDMLPWMLLSFGFLAILQGNWSQPTSLGFCTLIAGLIIGVLNEPLQKARSKKAFPATVTNS